MDEKLKALVKHALDKTTASCCLNVGFATALLLYSNMVTRMTRGDNKEDIMEQFVGLMARAQSALMNRNNEEFAKVILDAGGTTGNLADSVDADTLTQYLDLIRGEIGRQKAERPD